MELVEEEGNKESEWDVEEEAKIWRNASPTCMRPRTTIKSLHKPASLHVLVLEYAHCLRALRLLYRSFYPTSKVSDSC